jgi:hypothetical protein
VHHFVREADDSGILEELLKNSEKNLAKSEADFIIHNSLKRGSDFF